ncbi:hypothetical protein N0V82_003435 [Gnomoniopsis sp. IMI 355080]|nr:hypothetical protein N0V82_003435 [Gnomoniopsis sp. IMI 355080]
MDVHDRFRNWQDRLLRIQLRPDMPPEPKAFVEQIAKAVQAASTLFCDTTPVLRETGEVDLDHEVAFRDLMYVEKQRNALWNLLNNVVNPEESKITIYDEWWSGYALGTLWEIRREIADELDKMSEFDETWIQRRVFNDAIRPFARPLSIYHISIELWTMIFEQVTGEEDNGPLWLFSDYVAGGRNPIKDIRLACRLFCDASSHLLFRRVDVALHPDSLERLDQISRHGLFSATVRAIRVDLSGYDYRKDLIEDELEFMSACFTACRNLLHDRMMAHHGFHPIDERKLLDWQVGLSVGQTAEVFEGLVDTMDVWQDYLKSKGAKPSLDGDEVSADYRAAILAQDLDAGLALLHLDVKISWNPETIWELDAEITSGLRALGKTLKSFEYHGPPDFPRIDASSIQEYLSALVSGANLERLEIAFLLEKAESMCIGPVLASLSSGTKLRFITLRDCSFHLHQLQSVLQNCTPNKMILVALHGTKLQSGTWADALDALREAAPDRTTVAYVDRPGGAECDNMSREQYNLIFLSGFDQPYKHSKANKYISSSFCNHIQNPLRLEPVEDGPSPAGQNANNDT